jgi:hypothetical protein
MNLNDRLAAGQPGGPHLLDAAQLLRHILCIHNSHGRRFRLVYLWYNVPCEEGDQHRREAEEFKAAIAQDGIQFQPVTYQELILRLADSCQGAHKRYIDYLHDRYLFA